MLKAARYSIVLRSINWQACDDTLTFPAACTSVPMEGDRNNTAAVHTASNALIALFNVFLEKIDFFTFLSFRILYAFSVLYIW